MNRFLDYVMSSILDPALAWVLNHPIVSGVAVVLLIYVSVRNYRML